MADDPATGEAGFSSHLLEEDIEMPCFDPLYVMHKPVIEEQDLQKLKSSGAFSLSSPLSLRVVWFHVVLFFSAGGSVKVKEA